jgi:hypothetical protein
MTRELLTALHVALTKAWTSHLGAAVAKERAANALQSLAVYEPGDDITAALRNALQAASDPAYGGVQIDARIFDGLVYAGLESLLGVFLADARAREKGELLWDALGQVALR